MAAPTRCVTEEDVCAFFVDNGGQVTNKQLVTHFRNPSLTQAEKEKSRELLKSIVNKVASIQTSEIGEKFLVLKAEFQPEASPPPPDFSSSLLDDVLSAFNEPRVGVGSGVPSNDAIDEGVVDEIVAQPPASFQDRPASRIAEETETATPPRLPASRTKQTSSSSPRVPLPSYEDLFVKTPRTSPSPAPVTSPSSGASDPSPVPPPRKTSRSGSVRSAASNSSRETPTPHPHTKQRLPLKEVNTIAQGDATLASPEDMSIGSESVTTGSAADLSDATPSTPGSPLGDGDENSVVSVKERAQKLNKIQSEIDIQKQSSPQRKTTGERSSGIDDDGHSSGSIELSKEQRTWLVLAATADYHPMARMLSSNPTLAKMKDFISGYSALHWAAKAGEVEVVKLVAGCGVDVNAKSNGGYTALHLAAMHGHHEIMNILEEAYGANPNIRDHSGKRPKQYVKNTVQILFNGQNSNLLSAAAQGFAQRGSVSFDDEESFLYRGGLHSASFSARVKRTRDHFLAHFLNHATESEEGAERASGHADGHAVGQNEVGGGDGVRFTDIFHPSHSPSAAAVAAASQDPSQDSQDHSRRSRRRSATNQGDSTLTSPTTSSYLWDFTLTEDAILDATPNLDSTPSYDSSGFGDAEFSFSDAKTKKSKRRSLRSSGKRRQSGQPADGEERARDERREREREERRASDAGGRRRFDDNNNDDADHRVSLV